MNHATRVVICNEEKRPAFVFGPFDDFSASEDFKEKHKKICGRLHVTRKLNSPSIGVRPQDEM